MNTASALPLAQKTSASLRDHALDLVKLLSQSQKMPLPTQASTIPVLTIPSFGSILTSPFWTMGHCEYSVRPHPNNTILDHGILDQFIDAFQIFKGLLSQRAITPLLGKLAYDVLKIFEASPMLLVNEPTLLA
ncbi:hypothetical protein B0H13DRAFT_2302399 [Mycena leptocephala]|nr:hypothetical protein B0H13DRAFT_2302399 [Mycena leptocephala]